MSITLTEKPWVGKRHKNGGTENGTTHRSTAAAKKGDGRLQTKTPSSEKPERKQFFTVSKRFWPLLLLEGGRKWKHLVARHDVPDFVKYLVTFLYDKQWNERLRKFENLDDLSKNIDIFFNLKRPNLEQHLSSRRLFQKRFEEFLFIGFLVSVYALCNLTTYYMLSMIDQIETINGRMFINHNTAWLLIAFIGLVLLGADIANIQKEYFFFGIRESYGRARWLDKSDLLLEGMLAPRWNTPQDKSYVAPFNAIYDFVVPHKMLFTSRMFIGKPGSGKSSTFHANHLRDISRFSNAICVDIKGELYEMTAHYFKHVYRLDLKDSRYSDRFNIIAICKDDETLASNIAYYIINGNSKQESANEGNMKFFNEASKSLLTALILHLTEDERRFPNATINDVYTILSGEFPEGAIIESDELPLVFDRPITSKEELMEYVEFLDEDDRVEDYESRFIEQLEARNKQETSSAGMSRGIKMVSDTGGKNKAAANKNILQCGRVRLKRSMQVDGRAPQPAGNPGGQPFSSIGYRGDGNETGRISWFLNNIIGKSVSPRARKTWAALSTSGGNDPRTMGNIVVTLLTAIECFREESISRCFTLPNEEEKANGCKVIDWNFLRSEKPTCLYIVMTAQQSTQLGGIVAAVFGVAMERLLKQVNDPTAKTTTVRPCYLQVDEGGNFKINGIAQFVAQCRGSNVCVDYSVQSIVQLENLYGEKYGKVMMEVFGTKIVLPGAEGHTAEYISKMLGDTTTRERKIVDGPGVFQDRQEDREIKRPIMQVEEIRTMAHMREALIIMSNKYPLRVTFPDFARSIDDYTSQPKLYTSNENKKRSGNNYSSRIIDRIGGKSEKEQKAAKKAEKPDSQQTESRGIKLEAKNSIDERMFDKYESLIDSEVLVKDGAVRGSGRKKVETPSIDDISPLPMEENRKAFGAGMIYAKREETDADNEDRNMNEALINEIMNIEELYAENAESEKN